MTGQKTFLTYGFGGGGRAGRGGRRAAIAGALGARWLRAETKIAVAVLAFDAAEFVRKAEAGKVAIFGIENIGLGGLVVGAPAVVVRGDGKNVGAAAVV